MINYDDYYTVETARDKMNARLRETRRDEVVKSWRDEVSAILSEIDALADKGKNACYVSDNDLNDSYQVFKDLRDRGFEVTYGDEQARITW